VPDQSTFPVGLVLSHLIYRARFALSKPHWLGPDLRPARSIRPSRDSLHSQGALPARRSREAHIPHRSAPTLQLKRACSRSDCSHNPTPLSRPTVPTRCLTRVSRHYRTPFTPGTETAALADRASSMDSTTTKSRSARKHSDKPYAPITESFRRTHNIRNTAHNPTGRLLAGHCDTDKSKNPVTASTRFGLSSPLQVQESLLAVRASHNLSRPDKRYLAESHTDAQEPACYTAPIIQGLTWLRLIGSFIPGTPIHNLPPRRSAARAQFSHLSRRALHGAARVRTPLTPASEPLRALIPGFRVAERTGAKTLVSRRLTHSQVYGPNQWGHAEPGQLMAF